MKKLKSETGATLIVGLLFFVMCATIGSIILTAATAASGKIKSIQKADQAEYTINSASDLIYKIIVNDDFSCSFSGGYIDEISSEDNNSIMVTDIESTIESLTYYTYDHYVFDAIKTSIENNEEKDRFILTRRNFNENNYLEEDDLPIISSREEVVSINMKLEDGFLEENEKLQPVNVKITMYNNFDIKVELKLEETGNNSAYKKSTIWYYANDIDITLNKTLKDSEEDENSIYMNDFTVNWPSSQIVS